jgi:hypothetical protein
MQTVALGFLPKTLDLDLAIWNIRRIREDKVFLTPKRGALKPFIWRAFTDYQIKKRGIKINS